jgi:hypothetical protein
MFGHLKARLILTVNKSSVEEALAALLTNTENARPVRWIEFPTAILVLLTVPGDADSGALYVFDRNTRTWLWVDFEDEQFGGYNVLDFDLLVHEYDFLTLVERPGLLRATSGWLLEPGKPAEMAAPPMNSL